MTNAKPLSTRQIAVIEDLFEGGLEKQAILEKHKLSRNLLNKWLADEVFTDRLNKRLAWEHRRNEFMFARYTRVAVSNLVRLTGCEQPETARKACIDIITVRANLLTGKGSTSLPALPSDNHTSPPESLTVSPETAGKVLAVFAEEKTIDMS
jgi:hypothetical protein